MNLRFKAQTSVTRCASSLLQSFRLVSSVIRGGTAVHVKQCCPNAASASAIQVVVKTIYVIEAHFPQSLKTKETLLGSIYFIMPILYATHLWWVLLQKKLDAQNKNLGLSRT
uniref:Uncharacterized protein n=1 Tax=Glossina pallidipes TaxID=7398 RepID=A0A1A9Z796_GLOPL